MGTIVARRPGTAERIRPPADTSASLRRLTADPAHGPLPALLLALTVLVGVVDAVSILSLGRVFVANMTGNVVFVGFALAGASGFSLAASLSALGGFLVGAAIGGLAEGSKLASAETEEVSHMLFGDGIGYSSLFFYHVEWESIRLAFSQHWLLILSAFCTIAAADWVFRHLLPAVPWASSTRLVRTAAVVLGRRGTYKGSSGGFDLPPVSAGADGARREVRGG